MHETPIGCTSQLLQDKVSEMVQFLRAAVENRDAAHEVEEGLWWQTLSIGREMFQMFFDLHGDGDEGEQVRLEEHPVRRLEELHKRTYLSVFGEFELWRAVYGTREGQKIEYVPLDARLKLPGCKFSYLLQDWDQSLTLEMPFAQVSAMMEKILGLSQSVNSLERTGRKMAQSVEGFWEALPAPEQEAEGALLVCTADGKGVPMRQDPEPAKSEDIEPEKGMQTGSKKMALLGSVYTIDPYARTPEEVLEALFRSPRAPNESPPQRPHPCFKAVRATLLRDQDDNTAPQVHTIFDWMANETLIRGVQPRRPLLVLMDGQDSLWKAARKYLPEQIIEILDLLHALSYLWRATHLFHRSGSGSAYKFARKQIRRILSGKVDRVILSLRRMGSRHNLSDEDRDELQGICTYLRNNAHRMAYDEYLAAGYPIASGVIEGAWRTVVCDRMERSGMRSVLEGAHAMLGLRSIQLSQLWDDFIQFRISEESSRLYPQTAANDDALVLSLAA